MSKSARQYAALPLRKSNRSLQVMLVTSRYSKRWVLPKGWPAKKLTPWQAAAREAFEEAGLKGEIAQKAMGSYEYDKWMSPGKTVRCKVKVFPLAVAKEFDDWPKSGERERAWVSPEEAAERVAEPELKALLLKLADRVTSQ